MPRAPTCSAHPSAPAVARCRFCNARLCNECFHLLAGKRPVCDRCALELTRGPRSHWPFAIAFVGATAAICAVLARSQKAAPTWSIWAFVIAIAVVVAIGVGAAERKAEPRVRITEREPDFEVDATRLERAPNPYRTRVARAARRGVPLSGGSTRS